MTSQIRQEQLYQDLSTILVLVKKMFKKLLTKPNQESLSIGKQFANEQSLTVSRCTQLIIKYKKTLIKKAQSLNIIGRFMCRIKQILNQIILCIPKQKIQMMVILKKIDLITVKAISTQNSSILIISLLQIISNCNSKLVHSLRIKSAATNTKQSKKQESKQSISISKIIEKQSLKQNKEEIRIKETQNKQSQLQMIMKNLQKYSILGIDKQYFRGRYFDMKNQQGDSFFQEGMLRNRNIKNVMNDFSRQYNKMVSKKNSARSQSKKIPNEQYLQSMPISWQINISESQSSNLFHRKRQLPSRSSTNNPRSVMNKSNQTFSYTVMDKSTQLSSETYRSTYEQKLIRSRNKKTIKLANTIIDLPQALGNYNAKEYNPQRRNFFKKSQEHLKFRYKYYQNNSFTTTPLNNKFKVMNPEILYKTICK